jgi:predicted nucleotidyltransferase component of viral defense system
MMTTEQIGELARHFKIDEASIAREYVQLLFLRSFYALKESRHVFFKGGTAIHFHLTIRLEFSQREKTLTKAVSLIETPFPLVSYPLVVHLDAEELLSEETRAILSRGKGRDYFDFWYLLSKGTPLREDYIREKMKWYGKDYRQEELTEIIADVNEKALYNDLAKFLPKHYRQTIIDLKKNIL